MAFDWDKFPVVQPATAAAPPAQAEAPAFNWDAHPVVQAPAAAPSALEAAARGVGQGATLGFSDELTGGGEALIDKVLGKNPDKSIGDLYSQHTAEARAANEAAQQAHPYVYGAGNLAGGVASGIATGGLGAETALGRIGVGAGMGAASGVGYGNPDDMKSGAEEALKGAVTGGLVGGAVEGVSSALNPENLETFAANRSAAAMGADKATIRRLGADKVQAIGREGLDTGIVTPTAGTDTMMQRAQTMVDQGGKRMGAVYDTLDNAGAGSVNPSQLAGKVNDELGDFYRTPINRDISSQFDNTIDSIIARGESAADGAMPGGNIPISEAQGLKQEIGKVAYPNGRKINPDLITPKQQMAQDAYGIINDAIDEAAARGAKTLNTPGLADELQSAKDQYGTGKGALGLLANREAKEQGNNFFGLGDQLTAGAGYIAKGPAGLAGVAAKKALINPFGNQTVAWSADKLADIIRSTPQALGPWAQQLSAAAARGGSSLGATNFVLQQTSPEYREHMRKLFDGQ